MNRRGFLGALAGLVAGAELDPERLLWRPKRYVVGIDFASQPDVSGIAIAHRFFEGWNEHQPYLTRVFPAGVKIGDTVQFRLPPRFRVVAGELRIEAPLRELWTLHPDGWKKRRTAGA